MGVARSPICDTVVAIKHDGRVLSVRSGYSNAMATLDEDRLKELLKTAIVEVLEERRDLVRELIEEAVEDIALVRAIEEGQKSPLVSRDEVFKILRSAT